MFVVHRHDASRLHFDLRLEVDGALSSWAVPRGFSYDPADKRLAVRTEDHPLAYESFEGVIPEGEYGAGTMEIWDRGTFRCVDAHGAPAETQDSIQRGELKVVLDGGRLRGEWHLVKTKADERSWLVFKSNDRYAAGPDRRSVDVDLRAAPVQEHPPTRPTPRPAGPVVAPFSDAEFVFELEFEGTRALCTVRPDEPDTRWHGVHKDLRERIQATPRLLAELAGVRAEACVLDGVLTDQDPGGGGLKFYAFDLLHFDGRDLRPLPLLDRKAVLARILPPRATTLLHVDHVARDGERLLETVEDAGLRGVVAKRADRSYRRRDDDWLRFQPRARAEREGSVAAAPTPLRAPTHRITNPGRIYWPDDGLTKSDLCSYYAAVADVLLPHLRGRPVHLHRFPHGIDGESFYQHKPDEGAPEWLRVESIDSADGERAVPHIVCDDRRTLLYLANLGSIDLHPWMSRVDTLDHPDWCVLDLDPKAATFSAVVEVAQHVGEILREVGIEPALKTSGKTGLHVCVRLEPRYGYEHSRMFAETIARLVARRHPDLATVERRVQKRGARVYVDFGQNRRGQTVVAPWVVRPVRGAPVSMPLAWDELGPGLDPKAFTILTAGERLEHAHAAFARAQPVDLAHVVDRLPRS